MQAADRAEPIEESHTLIFEDPSALLHFLKRN